MLLQEAESLSSDLLTVKEASGSNAKRDLAVSWGTPIHAEFLELVGNANRQWFITWDAVLSSQPVEDGIEWDDLWGEAEARQCKPSTTAGRIKSLLRKGWPENVLKAIVDKTPDCGLSIKEFLKVRGVKKPFAIALAADWCKMKQAKREEILSSKKYASSVKMDGLRMAVILAPHKREALSRAMKPLKNMAKLVEKLAAMFKEPVVLDGEILSASNSWNDSVTGVKKEGSNIKMVYHIFDCVPYAEYLSGDFKMPKAKRLALLDKYLKPGPDIVRVEFEPVFSVNEALAALNEALKQGWEGTVLHDMSAVYRPRPDKSDNRTEAWVKLKLWQSAEFRVTGFLAGTGKHLGRLGALTVEGVIDGDSIKSEVGTGFTDTLREEIWADQKSWLGRTVEVKFFAKTEGSLRFPSYLRDRTSELDS